MVGRRRLWVPDIAGVARELARLQGTHNGIPSDDPPSVGSSLAGHTGSRLTVDACA